MDIEFDKNLKINKKEEIIQDDFNPSKIENNKENISYEESLKYPSSFQLMLKVDLNDLLNSNFSSDFGRLEKIHELSNKNLGVLLDEKLIIISPKSFKEIKKIEPTYEERYSKNIFCQNKFIDFLELNNSDIVMWTSNIILIYDKKFNLKQRIDEFEHGNKCTREDYDYDYHTYYEINSIHELKNRKLVSCNSYGLKFYEKDNNSKYNLISTEKMDVDVHYLIEFKPNILILLQKHYDEIYDDMSGDDNYLISIYNLEDKILESFFKLKIFSMMGDFHKVNYIYSNKYLYLGYDKSIEIFNLEENMDNIYIKNDVYEFEEDCFGRYKKVMKEEKRINPLYSNYYDNLFFGSDCNGEINLYSFNNHNLNVYHNFKIKNVEGVIILKNYEFIIFTYDCHLYKFKPIFLKNN